MEHQTHIKGLIGEIEFMLYLTKKGFNILKPLNQNSRYDMVIEDGGKFNRIQIKYLTPHNGMLRVEINRPKRNSLRYTLKDIDSIGVFDSQNKKFYLIPINKIKVKSDFWLRLSAPRNGQKKNITYAADFEI